MHIGTVTLFVADVERALDFYTRVLGWEKRHDFPMDDGTRWLTVAPAGEKTQFVLARGFGGWSADKVGGFTGVVLNVPDAEVAAAWMMAAGVEFTTPPAAMPWGIWAQFVDSEENELGLYSTVSTLAEAGG